MYTEYTCIIYYIVSQVSNSKSDYLIPCLSLQLIINCHYQEGREENTKTSHHVPNIVSVIEPQYMTIRIPLPGQSRGHIPVCYSLQWRNV